MTGGNTLSMSKGSYLNENVLPVRRAGSRGWSPFSRCPPLLPTSCFFPHGEFEQTGAPAIKTSILIFQMKKSETNRSI